MRLENCAAVILFLLPTLTTAFNPINRFFELLFDGYFKRIIQEVFSPLLLVLANGPTGIVSAGLYLLTPFVTPLVPEVIRRLYRDGLYLFVELLLFLLDALFDFVFTVLGILTTLAMNVIPFLRRRMVLRESGVELMGGGVKAQGKIILKRFFMSQTTE